MYWRRYGQIHLRIDGRTHPTNTDLATLTMTLTDRIDQLLVERIAALGPGIGVSTDMVKLTVCHTPEANRQSPLIIFPALGKLWVLASS